MWKDSFMTSEGNVSQDTKGTKYKEKALQLKWPILTDDCSSKTQ
jgi:hypothetical protein